jgi:hypothetical protein
MIVSNNSILNILLPNDNKALKEVLKDADTKTLENLKNSNKNVSDVLKDLFTQLKTGNKTNTTVENLLKNTNIFKDLGNFTSSVKTLQDEIKNNPSLEKYKPILGSFLKDISSMDDNSLKELLNKSGVFQEAKITNSLLSNTTLPKNLEDILNQIKSLIKNLPQAEIKNIENLIEKLIQNNKGGNTTSNIQNNSDLKSLINLLQNLSKQLPDKQVLDLTNLTNQLKNISSNAQLVESKLSNSVEGQIKNLLSQIKEQLQPLSNQPEIKTILSNIDKILKTDTINLQDLKTISSSLETLTKSNSNPNLNNLSNQLKNLIVNNETIEENFNLRTSKENILTQTKDVLFQLKHELQNNKTISNSQTILKQIDNLILNNNLFSKNTELIEPKQLLNQLVNLDEIKTATTQNSNISNLVNNLKDLTDKITNLENKILSNTPVGEQKNILTQNIKEALTSLKNELLSNNTIDSKIANQVIDKLLNIQNLFSKIELPQDLRALQQTIQAQSPNLTNFQSLFSSNIDNLILNLKEAIINSSTNPNNLNLQQTILKNVEKLETLLNNFPLDSNKLNTKESLQNNIQNDLKTVLLQMQDDLSSKTDPKSIDTLKHVDKMVTQIEYFQLLSISSNSNSVYIPFLWDMLEDGNISMKKLNEDRFYCEINLNLKEFGQTQLLLSMYDKNKLDLSIFASKESFKQAIRENFFKLRTALNQADLIPINIKIIDLKKEKEIEAVVKKQNIYNQDNLDLGFGVNIKV